MLKPKTYGRDGHGIRPPGPCGPGDFVGFPGAAPLEVESAAAGGPDQPWARSHRASGLSRRRAVPGWPGRGARPGRDLSTGPGLRPWLGLGSHDSSNLRSRFTVTDRTGCLAA